MNSCQSVLCRKKKSNLMCRLSCFFLFICFYHCVKICDDLFYFDLFSDIIKGESLSPGREPGLKFRNQLGGHTTKYRTDRRSKSEL